MLGEGMKRKEAITSCEWCGYTDIKRVKQEPYIHLICQNPTCHHEWDIIEVENEHERNRN
jgi:hypothetical protein